MTEQTKKQETRKTAGIILDTNALFVPFQFNIDIVEELRKLLNRNFQLITLSETREELERIATGGSPKRRKQATCALKLAEKSTLLKIAKRKEGSIDDVIVQVAKKQGYAVLTNDRTLRNRLRDINVPVIYVRQKSRLEIEGRL